MASSAATTRKTPQQDRAAQEPGPWSREPVTATGRRLFTDNDPMDMLESDGVTWGDVVAIEREAAAPGAAALDRDVIARFLHGEMFDETPEQLLDLDATAYDMADRLIALLGARAAEPKPPESGE